MSDEWLNYVNDTRTTCKYGIKCYQKNPEHHKTFKHPPQLVKKMKNVKHKNARVKPYPATLSKDLKQNEMGTKTSEDSMTITQSEVQNTDGEAVNQHNIVTLNHDTKFYDKNEDISLFKDLFLVEMPSDFFKFFECLCKEKSIDQTLGSVNLQLIGPYDLILGKLPVLNDKDLYLIHWRFFYDPPEFQAVLKKKGQSEYHIGYYRDDPAHQPVFLASNDSAKDCHIKPIADNIFAAVYSFLEDEKKSSPFMSTPCQKLMEKVKQWANEHNFSLDKYDMKKRKAQTVARTLHGAGIVVPYNKKTELGYRPLIENDAKLKKMFAKLESSSSQMEKDEILSEIQPVINCASIAMDECDFGTGLEIGIDLFCSGLKELEGNAVAGLSSAYSLLKREAFAKIIQVHLKQRRKGPNMSIF